MSTIGGDRHHKFYIVQSINDPPTSLSHFADYSGRWLKWIVKANLSQVSYFEGTCAGGDSINPNDFKAGSLLYVMSGLYLLGKFVIDRPVYKNDRTIEVKGYQSTGSDMKNRKCLTETSGQITFVQDTLNNIFLSTGDSKGLLIDNQDQQILAEGTIDNSTDKFSMKFDYDNRIVGITKASRIAKKEWLISHGTNSGVPYDTGDYIDIVNRIGSSSSTYTFSLSGTTRNCKLATGNEETDSLINDCIVKGTDQKGTQVEAHLWDATGTKTHTDGALDGWVYQDDDDIANDPTCTVVGGMDVFKLSYTSGTTLVVGEVIQDQTTMAQAFLVRNEPNAVFGQENWSVGRIQGTFAAGHVIKGLTSGGFYSFVGWLSGLNSDGSQNAVAIKIFKGSGFPGKTNFYAKIDSERFQIYDCVTTNPNYDVLRLGRALSGGYDRGETTMRTIEAPHQKGADVVMLGDTASQQFTLVVDSTSGFDTTGINQLKVGSETIGYASVSSGTTFLCDGRSFKNSYAHGDNMRVVQYLSNGDHFEPETPDLTTTSSIRTYGIKTTAMSESASKSRDELDRKAMSIVENKNKVTRINLDVAQYYNVWEAVNIGDRVALTNSDICNIDPGNYRIMGFDYSFDMGKTGLMLFLNDDATRTYAMTDYTYADSNEETYEGKIQSPTRQVDTQRYNAGEGGTSGTPGDWGQNQDFLTQIKNLNDPTNPYDAVNKKYVDNALAGVSGGGTGVDEKVKVSATDTTTNYLLSKLAAGAGISLTTLSPGGNESVQITATGAPVSAYWIVGPSLYPSIQPDTSGGSQYLVRLGSVAGLSPTVSSGTIWYDSVASKFYAYNGSTVNEFAGAASVNYWGRVAGAAPYLYPINVGDDLRLGGDILCNVTLYDIGAFTLPWRTIYGAEFWATTGGGAPGKYSFDAFTTPYMTYTVLHGFEFWDTGSKIADIGVSGSQFTMPVDMTSTLTVANMATFNGNVQLGNAIGDYVSVLGYISTDLLPGNVFSYNLGSSTRTWYDLWMYDKILWHANDYLQIQNAGTGSPVFYVYMNGAQKFRVSYTGAARVYGNLQVDVDSRVFGNEQVDGNITGLGTLSISGISYLNGAVALGDSTADQISYNGRVSSNINPAATATYDLGSTAIPLRWNNINAVNGNFSGTLTATTLSYTNLTLTGYLVVQGDTTMGNASGDLINFVGSVNTDILPAVSGVSGTGVGSSGSRWGFIYADDGNFSGDVTCGDSTSDRLSVNARINTNLNPSATTTYDLGTSALRWDQLYASSIDCTSASQVMATFTCNSIQVNGSAAYTGYINGTLGVVGVASSTVAGTQSTATSFLAANSSNTLLANTWAIEPTSSVNTARLGSSTYRFNNGYFTNLYCTNQTAAKYITGATIEMNLLDVEDQAKLYRGEPIDSKFEQGEVLVWHNGKLLKSSTIQDKLVMGVADNQGLPIVLGAEPIKVFGRVKEGDFLVSGPNGCAVVYNTAKRGCIIAQALETNDEVQAKLIKAMIQKM
jgi:hypothetical protein